MNTEVNPVVLRYLRNTQYDVFGNFQYTSKQGITFAYKLCYDTKTLQVAFAVTSQSDNFNKKVGRELALNRLYSNDNVIEVPYTPSIASQYDLIECGIAAICANNMYKPNLLQTKAVKQITECAYNGATYDEDRVYNLQRKYQKYLSKKNDIVHIDQYTPLYFRFMKLNGTLLAYGGITILYNIQNGILTYKYTVCSVMDLFDKNTGKIHVVTAPESNTTYTIPRSKYHILKTIISHIISTYNPSNTDLNALAMLLIMLAQYEDQQFRVETIVSKLPYDRTTIVNNILSPLHNSAILDVSKIAKVVRRNLSRIYISEVNYLLG